VFKYFFIVGAQRSGTTYLYQLLNEHPQIEMANPVFPEPKFFLVDSLYKKGLNYYFKHYFKGKPNALLRGEKSTSYIESKKVARRLAGNFPDAKIVILLRNPIERAVSNYNFSYQHGLEKYSIKEAFTQKELLSRPFDKQKISVSPFNYLQRGRYLNYILMYSKYFSPKKIKILILEKFQGSLNHLSTLYNFLSVETNFIAPSLHKKINESQKSTNVSRKLRQYLESYYKVPNEKLEKYLKLDLRKLWHY